MCMCVCVCVVVSKLGGGRRRKAVRQKLVANGVESKKCSSAFSV